MGRENPSRVHRKVRWNRPWEIHLIVIGSHENAFLDTHARDRPGPSVPPTEKGTQGWYRIVHVEWQPSGTNPLETLPRRETILSFLPMNQVEETDTRGGHEWTGVEGEESHDPIRFFSVLGREREIRRVAFGIPSSKRTRIHRPIWQRSNA